MTAVIDPNLPLHHLLPIRMLVVTLECLQGAQPRFFHQGALSAFIRFLTGSPEAFQYHLRIDSPENGRVHYRPGDLYRFPVIGLAGSEPMLCDLISNLHQLPAAAPRVGRGIPFSDNWRLHHLACGLADAPVERLEDMACYGPNELDAETDLWLDRDRFSLRFDTPARLRRAKETIQDQRRDFVYCRDIGDLPPDLLLLRAHDSTATLLRNRGHDSPSRGKAPALRLAAADLFWLDVEYLDAERKRQVMGGLAGALHLRGGLSPAWWRLLVLGQLLGIGQRTAFGAGRYRLFTADGGCSRPRVLPAMSVLHCAAGADALAAAWRHVVDDGDLLAQVSGASDWDAEDDDPHWIGDAEDVEDELDATPADEPTASAASAPELELDVGAPVARLQDQISALITGRYRPPELRGYLLPKHNGGVRPLAVPPRPDRVLQRAVQQCLAQGIERLFSRGSHGYRPGRSRITAADAIRAAWDQGYRWVYESDVRDFFDSVDLNRLRERLRALYGDDPVVDAVINWMHAPVRFDGQRIERRNGLPQGSPLSPLMANLMLDDFDSDMQAAGFHLIRFADDFIVMCKDPDEAKRAGETASASLAEHGLELHPDKTRITAISEGFRYLGYLFVNDMVLDVSGRHGEGIDPAQVPPNSWLANLASHRAQPVARRPQLDELIARVAHREPVAIGERDQSGTLLCVTGPPGVVVTRNKHLQVLRDDRVLHHLPWSGVEAVLLFGNHQITTQAMHEALRLDCPIHLATGMGTYRGQLWSGSPRDQGTALWLRQAALFGDPDQALIPAIEVVESRLRHMRETLRQRNAAGDDSGQQLDAALRALRSCTRAERLRGIEGNATRAYYLRLGSLLPPEFAFERRSRRPPRDPFNVLLSLGYTLLYGYTDCMIRTAGLLPWHGFYHQGRGRHAALASDLMEPFRHLVERAAMTIVLRKELRPEDFSNSPAGACIIAAAARRKYLALLIHRLETPIKGLGDDQPATVMTHLYRQALSLRTWIRGDGPFRPWRVR